MNIQDALKETGKARKNVDTDNYAQLDISDRLYWHGIKDNVKNSPVQMESILADNWQPYHPKEEIRPEEAGELWEHNAIMFMTMVPSVLKDSKIYLKSKFDIEHFIDNVIHNQNGWKRLYPEVKEDVEEIVIEGVEWEETGLGIAYPQTIEISPTFGVFQNFINKPPMTMKLSWKKEA